VLEGVGRHDLVAVFGRERWLRARGYDDEADRVAWGSRPRRRGRSGWWRAVRVGLVVASDFALSPCSPLRAEPVVYEPCLWNSGERMVEMTRCPKRLLMPPRCG
jgi:hypothetical protein